MENHMETGPLFFPMDVHVGKAIKKKVSATALSPCGIKMEEKKWKGITKMEKSMDYPQCGTLMVRNGKNKAHPREPSSGIGVLGTEKEN
jgi:hypothetical protein